jgi:hypothetical protein
VVDPAADRVEQPSVERHASPPNRR